MRILNYLYYFYYFSLNWNPAFAWYLLRDEIRGEKKYHINTTGIDHLSHLRKKGIDTSHAADYMPAPFELLETVLTRVQSLGLSHFLDLGCGKGRTLCVATRYGFPIVEGIEFSKSFCIAAEKNLEHSTRDLQGIKWKIIHNDAYYTDIPDGVDCIFLNNPFDDFLIEKVIQLIDESLKRAPRKLYVVYMTPVHKEVFLKKGYKVSAAFNPRKYLEAVILTKKG